MRPGRQRIATFERWGPSGALRRGLIVANLVGIALLAVVWTGTRSPVAAAAEHIRRELAFIARIRT